MLLYYSDFILMGKRLECCRKNYGDNIDNYEKKTNLETIKLVNTTCSQFLQAIRNLRLNNLKRVQKTFNLPKTILKNIVCSCANTVSVFVFNTISPKSNR